MKKSVLRILSLMLSLLTILSAVPVMSSAAESEASEETTLLSLDEVSFEKRLTPIMGWSSWNAFGGSVSYDGVAAQADALVTKDLAGTGSDKSLYDVGYEYVNIDDCWQNGRDGETGRVLVNETKFPSGEDGTNGMKRVVDYIHSLGLKAGLYSDAGDNTCASASGSKAYGVDVGLWNDPDDGVLDELDENGNPVYDFAEDLWTYFGAGEGEYYNEDGELIYKDGIHYDKYYRLNPDTAEPVESWGFDFIKVDWCGGRDHGLSTEERYTYYGNIIKDIENATRRDKIFNICCWAYAGPWMFEAADSWRSGGDIDMSGTSFKSVVNCMAKMKDNAYLTGPGHVNDVDMLIVGKNLTAEEDKTHFGMWCMFSSPLIHGFDLRNMAEIEAKKPGTWELITNEELIALNQDVACLSAVYLGNISDTVEVWVKPLGSADSDTKAVALFNTEDIEKTVTFDFSTIGYTSDVNIRELYDRVDLESSDIYTVTLPAHGTSIVKVSPAENKIKVNAVTSVNSVDADVTTADDIVVYTEEAAENGLGAYTYEGTLEAHTSEISYNGVNGGIKLSGDAVFEITLPSASYEKTATLYLSGDGEVVINIEAGGKTLEKSLTLNGTTAFEITHFTSDPYAHVDLSVSGGEFCVEAIAVSNDFTPVVSNASVSEGNTSDTTYLTSEGTLDWLFYGQVNKNSPIRKANGGKQIFVEASSGEKKLSSNYKVSWTDGDLVSKGNSGSCGVTYGEGQYYEITLPASSVSRKASVYFGMYKADLKAEVIIGDETVYEKSISSTDTLEHHTLKFTYSADKNAYARVRLTLNNTTASNAYVFLNAVTLSGADADAISHIAFSENIKDAAPENADIYAIYGTNATSSGAVSEYLSEVKTPVKIADGDKLDTYAQAVSLALPPVTGLSRADVAFDVIKASAGVEVELNGKSEYKTVSDIRGGTSEVVSVWYDENSEASFRLAVNAIGGENGAIVLKSVSVRSGESVIADYPEISETSGTLDISLDAMSVAGETVTLCADVYSGDEITGSAAEEYSLTDTFEAITLKVTPEADSTAIKVYLKNTDDEVIGLVSEFDYPLNEKATTIDEERQIGGLTAHYFVESKNAVLLDVRSADEFASSTLDGAINIEYTKLIDEAESILTDKNAYIIVFCSAGKRSAQALTTLASMGYTNVFNLGKLDNYDVSDVCIQYTNTDASWVLGDVIALGAGNVSYYDDVTIKYSYGEKSTIDDAKEYDSNEKVEIVEVPGEAGCTIKAYLVLDISGETVASVAPKYAYMVTPPTKEDIDIFVSDLESFTASGWTQYIHKDASVNNGTIAIAGVNYEKGFSQNATTTIATSRVDIDIPDEVAYFIAVVGKDSNSSKDEAAVRFDVYIDDVLAASSPTLTSKSDDYYVMKVAIPKGASKMTFHPYGEPDTNHANWGNAGFVLAPRENEITPHVYISDLGSLAVTGNLAMYFREDRPINWNETSNNHDYPIRVGGRDYEKGISLNAGATMSNICVTVDVPENAVYFGAIVGHEENSDKKADGGTNYTNPSNPATFHVYADDVLLESSPALTGYDYYVFNVAIPDGTKQLKLFTEGEATGNHCSWANAGFLYSIPTADVLFTADTIKPAVGSDGKLFANTQTPEDGVSYIHFEAPISNESTDQTRMYVNFDKSVYPTGFSLQNSKYMKIGYRSNINITSNMDFNVGPLYNGSTVRVWGPKVTPQYTGEWTELLLDLSSLGYSGGEGVDSGLTSSEYFSKYFNEGMGNLIIKPYYPDGSNIVAAEYFDISYVAFFSDLEIAKEFTYPAEEINYTVEYIVDGETYAMQSYTAGDTIIFPEEPVENENEFFIGWETVDGSIVKQGARIIENMTLTASFETVGAVYDATNMRLAGEKGFLANSVGYDDNGDPYIHIYETSAETSVDASKLYFDTNDGQDYTISDYPYMLVGYRSNVPSATKIGLDIYVGDYLLYGAKVYHGKAGEWTRGIVDMTTNDTFSAESGDDIADNDFISVLGAPLKAIEVRPHGGAGVAITDGDYLDIQYIAFFKSKEAAEEYEWTPFSKKSEYTVSYVADGEVVYTETIASGSKLAVSSEAPLPTPKTGYVSKWVMEDGSKVNTQLPVYSDVTLVATYVKPVLYDATNIVIPWDAKYYKTETVNDENGDPYFHSYETADNVDGATVASVDGSKIAYNTNDGQEYKIADYPFMAICYRTNVKVNNPGLVNFGVDIILNGDTAGTTMESFYLSGSGKCSYTGDGEWTVGIIDLSTAGKGNFDGKNDLYRSMHHIMLRPNQYAGAPIYEGDYYDVRYIAFFSSLEEAQNYEWVPYNTVDETYTVKYDANGGKGAPASVTGKYGDVITVASNAPTLDGYKFVGWKADGSDTVYKSADAYVIISDTTLRAVWKEISETGDVNADGKVNLIDSIILSRNIAGWAGYGDSTIDTAAADVDADGELTPADVTILVRHLANWSGYEKLPHKN